MTEELKAWQKEIAEREKKMTNRELLDEVLDQAGGDDWDGAFTDKGKWEYEYLIKMLEKRLEGWLNE